MIVSMNGSQKIAARITDDRLRVGVGEQVFMRGALTSPRLIVFPKLGLGCRSAKEVKENLQLPQQQT